MKENVLNKKKSFRYKGWFCRWNGFEGFYYLYTPSEMEQPVGHRYHEYECETAEHCKEFINSYK
jgi:hypothetical protein